MVIEQLVQLYATSAGTRLGPGDLLALYSGPEGEISDTGAHFLGVGGQNVELIKSNGKFRNSG